MAKLRVLACPGCGASLSVGDDATVVCQFCGNTIFVPEELRSQTAASPAEGAAMAMPTSMFGTPTQLKQLGDLVRSGNKIAAIKLYREVFGGGLAEAKEAVERLARGEPVQVTNISGMGIPTQLRVANAPEAPAGSGAMAAPSMPAPMMMTGRPAAQRRSACGLLVVLAVIVIGIGGALIGVAAAFMPALIALPGLGSKIAEVTNQYAAVALSFGGEGTGAGLFKDARNIAVGPSGHIYVADYENPRVQIFDADGKFLSQWRLGGKDTYLSGMVVDRKGTLYAVYGSEIHRHDAETGDDLGLVDYEGGWGFNSIALTAEGGLVTSWYKARDDIVRFSAKLEPDLVIESAISNAAEDTELSTRVAVDGVGNIFAVGSFVDGIFRFSPSGKFVNRFSGEGDGPGAFTSAGAIAVDGQSRVYVSDFDGIEVFQADGRHVANITLPDGDPYVYGMTFDDQGYLYAVAGNKVYKLEIIGK